MRLVRLWGLFLLAGLLDATRLKVDMRNRHSQITSKPKPVESADLDQVLKRVRQTPKVDAVYRELEEMVGLDDIKKEVLSLIAYIWFNEDRGAACESEGIGVKALTSQTMHMQFLGNPGTGKTVVARIVAKLLITMGVVSRPDGQPVTGALPFTEAGRADLVSNKKGGTAIKVQKVVEQALGGVLFIDEAYSLAQGGSDFAREAVDTLVKLMEDHRKHLIVILAGYDKEMEQLFEMNTGLKSRVPFTFHFADYTCHQLLQVSEIMLHGIHGKGVLIGKPVTVALADLRAPLNAHNASGDGGFSCLKRSGKKKAGKDLWQLHSHPVCEYMLTTIRYQTGCSMEEIGGPSTNRENGNGRTVRNMLEGVYREMASRTVLQFGEPLVVQQLQYLKRMEQWRWEQVKADRKAREEWKGPADEKPKVRSEKQLNREFQEMEAAKPLRCDEFENATRNLPESYSLDTDVPDMRCSLVTLVEEDFSRVLQSSIREEAAKYCDLVTEFKDERIQANLEKQMVAMIGDLELVDKLKLWMRADECDEVRKFFGIASAPESMMEIGSFKSSVRTPKRYYKMTKDEKCTSCIALVTAMKSGSNGREVCEAYYGRATDYLCGLQPIPLERRLSKVNNIANFCDEDICFYKGSRQRHCDCSKAPKPDLSNLPKASNTSSKAGKKLKAAKRPAEVLTSVQDYKASCAACGKFLEGLAPSMGQAVGGQKCMVGGAAFAMMASRSDPGWTVLEASCADSEPCLDAARKLRTQGASVVSKIASKLLSNTTLSKDASNGVCHDVICTHADPELCSCTEELEPKKKPAKEAKEPSLKDRLRALDEKGRELMMCEMMLSGDFDASNDKLTNWRSPDSKLESYEWVQVSTECGVKFSSVPGAKVQCGHAANLLKRKSRDWYGFARYRDCGERAACYDMICTIDGKKRRDCSPQAANEEKCTLIDAPQKRGGKRSGSEIRVPQIGGHNLAPKDIKRLQSDFDGQVKLNKAEDEKTQKIAALMEQLREMIGLETVKAAVLVLKRLVDFDSFRTAFFGNSYTVLGQSFHMQFLGNPGTGKTYVARIVGSLLVEMGVIRQTSTDTPPFKEVSRADLVGSHVGETALLVQQRFGEAKGGVLFVDEAYSLVHKNSEKDFGHEAVSTMIAEMENKRKEVIVILAGYNEPMRDFFRTNPGFESRVPFEFLFEDYTCEQLMEIAELQMSRYEMSWGGAKSNIERLVKFQSGCCMEGDTECKADPEGGNGRSVRTLLERLFQTMANRVMRSPDVQAKLSGVEDFVVPFYESQQASVCPSDRSDLTLCEEITTLSVDDYRAVAKGVAEEALRKTCAPRPDFAALAAQAVAFDDQGWISFRKTAYEQGKCESSVEMIKILPEPSSIAVESGEFPVNEDCLEEAALAKLDTEGIARVSKVMNMRACRVFIELEGFIGLDKVKRTMYEVYDFVLFNYQRKVHGLPMMNEISYHMQFLGNPGTGKTVVARIVSKLLNALDVLTPWSPVPDYEGKKNHHLTSEEKKKKSDQEFEDFLAEYEKHEQERKKKKRKGQKNDELEERPAAFEEVSRSDLVQQYIGHTARKVQQVTNRVATQSGVLFIDEAYSLKRPGSGDTFGKEAVDTLIKEMEDKRAHFVTILAGYRNEMEQFISSNPGFKSRVQFTFNFDDYTCEELGAIGTMQLQNSFSIDPVDKSKGQLLLNRLIEARTGCCHTGVSDCAPPIDSGNGRAVRNLLETVTRRMATRLVYERSHSPLSCAQYTTLSYSDVRVASDETCSERLSTMCSHGGYLSQLIENMEKDEVDGFVDSKLVEFIEGGDVHPEKKTLGFSVEMNRIYELLSGEVDMTKLVSKCMTTFHTAAAKVESLMGDVCDFSTSNTVGVETSDPLDTDSSRVQEWTRAARFFLLTVDGLDAVANPLYKALQESKKLHSFLPVSFEEDLENLKGRIKLCRGASSWVKKTTIQLSLEGLHSVRTRKKILGDGTNAGKAITKAEELMSTFYDMQSL